jgi:hypothetical protein
MRGLILAVAFVAATALARPAAAGQPTVIVTVSCTVGGQLHIVAAKGPPGKTLVHAMTVLRQTNDCDRGRIYVDMSALDH